LRRKEKAANRNAKLDFESVENRALNDYLPKIFHSCPFTEEICTTGYCVPVSVTSQLKVVMLPVFAAAVNVNVAWIDAPTLRTTLCRFQVNINEEHAPPDDQMFVDMVRVSRTLPVFLT